MNKEILTLPMNQSDLLKLLICSRCKSQQLNSKEVELKNLVFCGSIYCESCNHQMSFVDGVLYVEKQGEFKPSRLELAYEAFWKHSSDNYDTDSLTNDREKFKGYASYFSNQVVLDAGCGNGRSLDMFFSYGASAVILIDITSSIHKAQQLAVESFAKYPVLCIRCSISEIPISKSAAETVWTSGVVGLIPNQEEAMDEIFRVSSKGVLLGVLTEKTMIGKVYLLANHTKFIINRIKNFDLLFGLSGFLAKFIFLLLKILWFTRIKLVGLDRKTLQNILQDPKSLRRIQMSLFDPIIIPKVVKHNDNFYKEVGNKNGYDLTSHNVINICDYFLFDRRK